MVWRWKERKIITFNTNFISIQGFGWEDNITKAQQAKKKENKENTHVRFKVRMIRRWINGQTSD